MGGGGGGRKREKMEPKRKSGGEDITIISSHRSDNNMNENEILSLPPSFFLSPRGIVANSALPLPSDAEIARLREIKEVESVLAYVRDVTDNIMDMLEKLAVSTEVLNHLDNSYLTRINLEVAQATEIMNNVMKKFSAVATIFIPLTVLVGAFGMNVYVPGQVTVKSNEHLGWFFGIISVCVLIAVISVCYFRRQGWY